MIFICLPLKFFTFTSFAEVMINVFAGSNKTDKKLRRSLKESGTVLRNKDSNVWAITILSPTAVLVEFHFQKWIKTVSSPTFPTFTSGLCWNLISGIERRVSTVRWPTLDSSLASPAHTAKQKEKPAKKPGRWLHKLCTPVLFTSCYFQAYLHLVTRSLSARALKSSSEWTTSKQLVKSLSDLCEEMLILT